MRNYLNLFFNSFISLIYFLFNLQTLHSKIPKPIITYIYLVICIKHIILVFLFLKDDFRINVRVLFVCILEKSNYVF